MTPNFLSRRSATAFAARQDTSDNPTSTAIGQATLSNEITTPSVTIITRTASSTPLSSSITSTTSNTSPASTGLCTKPPADGNICDPFTAHPPGDFDGSNAVIIAVLCIGVVLGLFGGMFWMEKRKGHIGSRRGIRKRVGMGIGKGNGGENGYEMMDRGKDRSSGRVGSEPEYVKR